MGKNYDDGNGGAHGALIDVAALMSAGAAAGDVKSVQGFRPVVMVPEGYTVEPLEFREPDPLAPFIKAAVVLRTLESFALYVKRYQQPETVIFVEVGSHGARITAVFDYHAAYKDGDTAPQTRRVAHTATYECPHSFEWAAWAGIDAKGQTQEAFANFIDQNSVDVVSPASAELLELALNFQMKASVNFSSDLVRQSGARTLKFVETIEATGGTQPGTIKVPEEIKLNIPVFFEGHRFDVTSKLYYRATNGKLSITLEMRRPQEVIQLAVKDVIADIATATGLTPLHGKLG